MKKHYPYLSDIQFLDKLYDQHNKTIYTRITVLDWWERPIEEVQGKITSASISENGDSSVRRTASLNVKIIDKDELYGNINSLFSINKKIFIETGLKNNLRHIRFHDLRHSCASLLLAKGIPMKAIQEWLGHSTYSTTANLYTHLESNTKNVSAKVLANAMNF